MKKKWFFASIILFSLSITGFSDKVNGAVFINTSLSVSEEYNDNLFFTEANQETDFVTSLSPALSIGYTSNNIILTLGYQGSAQFYSQNTNADGYFQSLSIDIDLPGLNRQIEGLEIQIIEEMTFSPELPGFSFGGGDDESAQRANRRPQSTGQGVQLNRTDTFQNQAGLSLAYDWTERLNTRLAYTNIITRFSDSTFEDRDANHTTFDGTYRYPVSSRTAFSSTYDIALTTGDGRDQLIQSIRLGAEHQISRLVSANASAGVSFLRNESARHTLSAGFSRRFKTGSLDIRYTNSISTGLGVIRSVTRNESVSGSINHRLGDRVSSTLQVGYAKNKSLSGNEVDTATSTASTGISVQLLKWLSGNLEYSYLKQDSEGLLGVKGEIARNLITLSFTASGPSWRMLK